MKKIFSISLAILGAWCSLGGAVAKEGHLNYFQEKDIEDAIVCLQNPDCTTASKIYSLAALRLITQDASKEIKHVVKRKLKKNGKRFDESFQELRHDYYWPENLNLKSHFYYRLFACSYLTNSKNDLECTKDNCPKKIRNRILDMDARATEAYADTLDDMYGFFQCKNLVPDWMYKLLKEYIDQIQLKPDHGDPYRDKIPSKPADPDGEDENM